MSHIKNSKKRTNKKAHFAENSLAKNDEEPVKSTSQMKKRSRSAKKDIYEVEEILDVKGTSQKKKYLVKWKVFPQEEASWEPLSNLENCQLAIDRFEKKQSMSAHPKQKNSQVKKSSSMRRQQNESNEEFEIESILDDRVVGKKTEYLVAWKGCPESQNSWFITIIYQQFDFREPDANMSNCQPLLQAYLKSKSRNSEPKRSSTRQRSQAQQEPISESQKAKSQSRKSSQPQKTELVQEEQQSKGRKSSQPAQEPKKSHNKKSSVQQKNIIDLDDLKEGSYPNNKVLRIIQMNRDLDQSKLGYALTFKVIWYPSGDTQYQDSWLSFAQLKQEQPELLAEYLGQEIQQQVSNSQESLRESRVNAIIQAGQNRKSQGRQSSSKGKNY